MPRDLISTLLRCRVPAFRGRAEDESARRAEGRDRIGPREPALVELASFPRGVEHGQRIQVDRDDGSGGLGFEGPGPFPGASVDPRSRRHRSVDLGVENRFVSGQLGSVLGQESDFDRVAAFLCGVDVGLDVLRSQERVKHVPFARLVFQEFQRDLEVEWRNRGPENRLVHLSVLVHEDVFDGAALPLVDGDGQANLPQPGIQLDLAHPVGVVAGAGDEGLLRRSNRFRILRGDEEGKQQEDRESETRGHAETYRLCRVSGREISVTPPPPASEPRLNGSPVGAVTEKGSEPRSRPPKRESPFSVSPFSTTVNPTFSLMDRPRIVILGGGFAGIECAKEFRKKDVEVVIVDRQNHHLFQPLLYQVASAGLAAPEIAHPIRSIFANQENVTVRMAEITGVDLERKVVHLDGEEELSYDYVVLAMGVKTGFFGNDQWAEHARGLKTLDDATAIRRDVLYAFEQAESCDDPEERERLMAIGIVGGGPTGVEMAGAFAELARHVLTRDFRHIDTDKAKIYLIEALPRVLHMYDEELSEYTRRSLEEMGVTVIVDSPVKDLQPGKIVLEDRTIEAANIVWSAGVQASKMTADLGVEVDKGGRIHVETDLSIPNHPEAFVAGDLAHCVDQTGCRVPGLCPSAMQMGKHAAKVIIEEIEGKVSDSYPVRRQFRYFDKGSMATIGRSRAVAEAMGMKLDGLVAWLMWLFVHLLFLVGFRNRIAVLMQWFYAYVRYRRGARIITGLEGLPRPRTG